jgi:hypothetical protein
MKAKLKSPAKQTTTGDWKNKTTDPTVLANRKAADAKLKANQANAAKAKKGTQVKSSDENTAKYNQAKAISTSKDKANDKMIGSWTNRQKADKTLKDLSDSGYKPATKAVTKPATKPATKPVAKPAAKTNGYEAANKGGAMDKLVKARNSAAKGSREYAAAQNQINAAMGSKVKHTAKKETSVSSLKPANLKSNEGISLKGIKTTNSTIPEEPKSSPATMRKSSMAKMKKKC